MATNPTNLVNPGSVYQTYTPGVGTTYSAPPTGLYSGTGASVATPTNLPQGVGTPQVAQGDGSFTTLTKDTGFVQPDLAKPATQGGWEGIYNVAPLQPVTQLKQPEIDIQTGQPVKSVLGAETGQITPAKMQPIAPIVLPSTGVVARDMVKETAFVQKWNGGKGVLKPGESPRLPTAAEVNKAVYGTATPKFSSTGGLKPEAVVAKAEATLTELDKKMKELEGTQTPEEQKAQGISDMLLKLIPQQEGQQALLSQELAKAGGANEMQRELASVKAELGNLVAEKKATMIDISGKPMTLARMYGAEAENQAKYDSRIFTLTSQANGLIGNIAQAKEDAQLAVDAKYKPIEEKIAIYQAQLKALEPILTKQEKLRADAQLALSEEHKQQIADQKAAESQAFDLQMAGYTKISGPSQLKGLSEAQILRVKTPTGTDIYKKPPAAMSELETYAKKKQIDELYKTNKFEVKNIGGVDKLFNPETGEVRELGNANLFTPGAYGGQCGDYVHKIADNIPALGDSIEEKTARTNVTAAQFAANPQVGDVIISKTNLPNGHVSLVTAVNGDKVTVTESNYGLDEKVGNRTVSVTDPRIIGVYRGGTIKSRPAPSSTYTAGADPVVDSWVDRIQSGQAKITEIPATQAALRNKVSVGLAANGNSPDGKPTVTDLGKEALKTAKEIKDKLTTAGTDWNNAIGKTSAFNWAAIPGTARKDALLTIQSLKDKLSLEGVKYLKGQGQVSDAERALLASAVTKLNPSQSEAEFNKTLQEIIDKLSGTPSSSLSVKNIVTAPDGEQIEIID